MKETRERERERRGRTQFISAFDGVEEVKQGCVSRIRGDSLPATATYGEPSEVLRSNLRCLSWFTSVPDGEFCDDTLIDNPASCNMIRI
jgi:hypothetical protein